MKDIIKLPIILASFGIVAAVFLGAIHSVTKPQIEWQTKKTKEDALRYVLPEAKKIEEVKVDEKESYFKGYTTEKTSGEPEYYAFIAKGQGYSSVIQTMVGVDKKGNIIRIKIMFQQETPGLGAKCEDEEFTSEFTEGEKSAFEVAVDKDGGEITSITGATITSRAIANSINQKIKWLDKQVNLTKNKSD